MSLFAGIRCLIIGYGSIGSRHAKILKELGGDVALVTRRRVEALTTFADIGDAVSNHNPEYVVVSNETSRHCEALVRLAGAGYSGKVLVEKPIFERASAMPENGFHQVSVAYNLRFHPIIVRMKELLVGQEILSAHGYVGQYLPEWRPETDYRRSYSARDDMGGGVLLDLSHDLDYLLWMLGDWEATTALGGHLSPLEITSDDLFTVLVKLSRCPVAAVQLNYLDRCGRRRLMINTAHHTYEADLIRNSLMIDRDEEFFTVERDDTYRSMHTAVLNGEPGAACSVDEALSALHLIDAARRAAKSQEWVRR